MVYNTFNNMQIKIFGKNLFEYKKKTIDEYLTVESSNKKAKTHMQDFMDLDPDRLLGFVSLSEASKDIQNEFDGKKEEKKKGITPKEVYTLKLLNAPGFTINCDPKYVEQQISDFKDKLSLLSSEEYDMRKGIAEISSILMRFENRKQYTNHKEFFEEYPYTTTSKVQEMVKNHSHLKVDKIGQFIADMPKDAIETMKAYEKKTMELCGLKPVFYIIADKKDFKKTDARKDPILLVQSPFGHFWQILGAWDEEMLFLEEL